MRNFFVTALFEYQYEKPLIADGHRVNHDGIGRVLHAFTDGIGSPSD